MRPRVAIVLLVVLALVAGALLIRRGDGRGAVEDREKEAAADDPIVAPSRVVAVGDEPRVVLDSAERRRSSRQPGTRHVNDRIMMAGARRPTGTI